jgi:hypothetical protein
MDTADLTRVLRDATADLAPRPGFTGAVVKGGRRRQNRRRLTIATGITTVTALAGASTYAIWLNPSPSNEIQTGDPRLSQPTRGDLATDDDFLASATRLWRDGGLATSWDASRGVFDDLRSAPHVYWAGNTPVGPAAIVMQQAYLHPHGDLSPSDFNRLSTVSGLIATDPADGTRKLVATHYGSVKDRDSGVYLFGPGDRTLLVVDFGTPLWFSATAKQLSNGRISHDWQRMQLIGGVAVTQLPDGIDPSAARILAQSNPPAQTDKDPTTLIYPLKASEYLKLSQRKGDVTLNGSGPITVPVWRGDDKEVTKTVGKPTQVKGPINVFQETLEKAGMLDMGGGGITNGQWSVTAGLPDGRVAITSERVLENQPFNNLFTIIVDASGAVQQILPGPKADPATLPFTVHLPDGQGWLAINYGATLQFRTSPTAPWETTAPDAALLPEDAVDVQSTKNGTPNTTHLAN